MKRKIYVSEWIKLGPKESDSIEVQKEKYNKQTKALKLLDKMSLNLLIDLVNTNKYDNIAYMGLSDFIEHLIKGLGMYKTINVLLKKKEYTMLRRIVTDTSIKVPINVVKNIISILAKANVYDDLLILGKYIALKYPKSVLTYYAKVVINKIPDYTNEIGPANPISCLIRLSADITMMVEQYFKTHNYPEAYKKWKEYRKNLGI